MEFTCIEIEALKSFLYQHCVVEEINMDFCKCYFHSFPLQLSLVSFMLYRAKFFFFVSSLYSTISSLFLLIVLRGCIFHISRCFLPTPTFFIIPCLPSYWRISYDFIGWSCRRQTVYLLVCKTTIF